MPFLNRLEQEDDLTISGAEFVEKGDLAMSVPENIGTTPRPRGGDYELARFNALRHGVLSQYTVLPWEDGDEYRSLLEALVAEHKPQGPTEEHLVEEVAGVIWRKRRLRTEARTAEDRAELESDQAMTEKALRLLGSPSASAYSRALAALRDDTREWWAEQLTWEPDDYDQDQTPYSADAASLICDGQPRCLLISV